MTNAQSQYFENADHVAINGYDVVNYFTQNSAERGSKTFAATLAGTTFYFVSAENQQAFKADPKKYLPQYGGYCAFAMGMKNAKAAADPETFKLYNGQLYLFFNDYYEGTPFNTIVPWNSDEANFKAKADANWKGMN